MANSSMPMSGLSSLMLPAPHAQTFDAQGDVKKEGEMKGEGMKGGRGGHTGRCYCSVPLHQPETRMTDSRPRIHPKARSRMGLWPPANVRYHHRSGCNQASRKVCAMLSFHRGSDRGHKDRIYGPPRERVRER